MFALRIVVLFFLLQVGKNGFCQDLSCLNPANGDQLAELFNVTVANVCEVAQEYICANATETLGPVRFLLYLPSSNQTVTIDANNASQYMNFSNPTKIIIHGWLNSGTWPWVVEMAWLFHQKEDCNVVAVDWSGDSFRSYPESVSVVPLVGYRTADFLIALQQYLASFLQNCHVIGHSLGGQASGFVGKRIIEITGEPLPRITPLDAAAPLFEDPIKRAPDCRVNITDAKFMDLIHTETLLFGVSDSYGDQDFFVDYGLTQAPCTDSLAGLTFIVCDHLESIAYYSATIPDPQKYEALACDTGEDFVSGSCNNNEKAPMGDGATPNVTGNFYINIDRDGNTNNP